MIDATLHSREIHAHARHINEHPSFFTPVERAWAVWVCTKLGFASMIDGTFGYDRSGTTTLKLRNAKKPSRRSCAAASTALRSSARTASMSSAATTVPKRSTSSILLMSAATADTTTVRSTRRIFAAARHARDGRREVHAHDVSAREDRTPRRPVRLDDPSARPHHHRLESLPPPAGGVDHDELLISPIWNRILSIPATL